MPDPKIQDEIAKTLRSAAIDRDIAIRAANETWKTTVGGIIKGLSKSSAIPPTRKALETVYSIQQVRARLEALGAVQEEAASSDDDEDGDEDEPEE